MGDPSDEATVDAARPRDRLAPANPRTPDGEADTIAPGLDTAHLRNAVHRRVFGTSPEPVRIGRYPILRRLGKGGMGVVYAGFDNELDRKVAIKLLAPGGDDDGRRERLQREAKALARLSHPGIVQIYEVGTHGDGVYLAMELVDGATLRGWIAAAPRRLPEIVAHYLQVGRALAAAHAAGIVHRDFKPDNAIVGSDGRVRVLDFGLARAVGEREPD
ncbi:MAG TPA: serine/threonine-protein kinase, partial [Nannocystaceae bacterium]|nr:serine/threonine-protein kinase [Nannocystaceae bacterium]